MSNPSIKQAVRFLQRAYAQLADPRKAVEMAAYMKTEMPFYGIQKPQREPIDRQLVKEHAATSATHYCDIVRALWELPHREEKYAAIEYAKRQPEFIRFSMMPLYRSMIRQGAWWDFVDPIAGDLVGTVLAADPDRGLALMDKWIDDRDMWIRRTALICQLKLKEQTDSARLFRYCEHRAHEKEFFIRKAIGWALRQYAYTDPDAVTAFLRAHRDDLSPLSFREASKHLNID